MIEWSIKDLFEVLAYGVAILSGIAGAFVFFRNERNSAIENTREAIVRAWTNEGDISSIELPFITLDLENSDGDIIGSLSTSAYDRILEVHADVDWFSIYFTISELRGRNVCFIAKVKGKLSGNNNRLEWKVVNGDDKQLLPPKTVLWPSVVRLNKLQITTLQ